jgi:hypothetical protein
VKDGFAAFTKGNTENTDEAQSDTKKQSVGHHRAFVLTFKSPHGLVQ